ncbi:MAG: CRISPR-associated endonuclease Cas2 [Candidatus Cryptobacteroides sp.]
MSGRKKKEPVDYLAILRNLSECGVRSTLPKRKPEDEIEPLDTRIKRIFELAERAKKNVGNMLFFVMYDIEDDKVRRYVVKYLEKRGCMRIQKSIFLANQPVAIFDEIKNDLEAVQKVYENDDSILVVPITADYLNAMKIIGNNINIDIVTRNKTTLFF